MRSAFLSEITSGQREPPYSSFVDMILTLVNSGRCLNHQRRCLAENAHRTGTSAFWDRHRSIDILLTKNKAYSIPQPSHDFIEADPLLLLSKMMSNALVLTMYKLINAVVLDTTRHKTEIEQYEQKALIAAEEITTLSGLIPSLSYFKVILTSASRCDRAKLTLPRSTLSYHFL